MKLVFAVFPVALAACAVDALDPPAAVTESATLEANPAPLRRLLQAGTALLPLEVTDDNYAIYQDGAQVFAASLGGGRRRLVADVPAGNTAFVYHFGRVAFVWTNPDRTLPNFGVSPLVVWSAATGAHLASPSSAIGTLGVAASRRGDFVIFPSNSTPDGTVGDLVYASTDLARQTTLIAGAQMGFAIGPCNPLATFMADGDPIAIYCTTDPSTATLSRWTAGVRRDLVAAAAAPPALAVDLERERVLTLAAGSRNPLLVDRRGNTTALAAVSGRVPSFGPDGTIYYATRSAPPPAAAQLFRFRAGTPQLLGDVQGFYRFPFGSRTLTAPLTSPDGRSFLVLTSADPTTGFGDVVRLDARGNGGVTLDATLTNVQFGPPFSDSSDFALYAKGDPTFTTFTGAMFAAGRHGIRQFSDGLGWGWLAGQGDTLFYNDNTVADPANLLLATADLKVVDLGRGQLAPKLIAAQANANIFTTDDKTAVVYTTDHGEPGLYVARAW